MKIRALFAGLLLVAGSFAPAPSEEKQARGGIQELARLRYESAGRQFEEMWSYYRQSRVSTFDVYYWSRLLMDSQEALSDDPANRLAAVTAHAERMQRLEELNRKVLRLGLGRSIDVGTSGYYRLEAAHWLAQIKPR